LELNKLSAVQLIEVVDNPESNQKQYRANSAHPLFDSLRGFVLKQFGLDSLIERVFDRLGDLEAVYLTHDWAEGKMSPFMDFVVVGQIDQNYMYELILKAEPILQRKIRVAVFHTAVEIPQWNDIPQIKLI